MLSTPAKRRAPWGALVLLGLFGAEPAGAGGLKEQIEKVIDRPQFAPAFWAIEVRDMASGTLLYDRNARKNMMPASMFKLLATATALDALGPDARVRTTLETGGSIEGGTLSGDLFLVGRGDPGLADRGPSGSDGLDALADGLVAAGVSAVDGSVVGEDLAFPGERRGPSWEWGDLVWCYGAEVSALSWNSGCADLAVSPGAEVGAPVVVRRRPESAYYEVQSTATTSPPTQKADLKLVRELGSSTIRLSGTYPAGAQADLLQVALENPAQYAATVFAERLASRGIHVTGGVKALGASPPATPRVLASRDSEPLAVLLKETNKPSHNLRAETLLRWVGLQAKGEGTIEAGLEAVNDFLKSVGIDVSQADLEDASGMAVTDLIAPHEVVDLLVAMDRHKYAAVFKESLPVAGRDGTLEYRMKGTTAESRVVAKTGARRHVASLAGYATSVSGRRLVFSIVLNHHTLPNREAAAAIDEICEILARE